MTDFLVIHNRRLKMSNRKVVVLGVNGHIGKAVTQAFVTTGWDVTGMARTDRYRIAGVRFVPGDSDSVDDMRRAIGDAEVVVNALNLPYPEWDKGRMEAQMGRVIEALGTVGRTVLFPGNIYNFSASDRFVAPDTRQNPQTSRGGIRVRIEQMFETAAARGDIQAIILRAGDFYGPGSTSDWFDQAIFREIDKGKVATMGVAAIGHSWAYLPDLARAFEALASTRSTLGAFERFHFAGHFVTPEQMRAAIERAAPVPVKVCGSCRCSVSSIRSCARQARWPTSGATRWSSPTSGSMRCLARISTRRSRPRSLRRSRASLSHRGKSARRRNSLSRRAFDSVECRLERLSRTQPARRLTRFLNPK
jgi:nucleoside-diphosphate-sugar epimerase